MLIIIAAQHPSGINTTKCKLCVYGIALLLFIGFVFSSVIYVTCCQFADTKLRLIFESLIEDDSEIN